MNGVFVHSSKTILLYFNPEWVFCNKRPYQNSKICNEGHCDLFLMATFLIVMHSSRKRVYRCRRLRSDQAQRSPALLSLGTTHPPTGERWSSDLGTGVTTQVQWWPVRNATNNDTYTWSGGNFFSIQPSNIVYNDQINICDTSNGSRLSNLFRNKIQDSTLRKDVRDMKK